MRRFDGERRADPRNHRMSVVYPAAIVSLLTTLLRCAPSTESPSRTTEYLVLDLPQGVIVEEAVAPFVLSRDGTRLVYQGQSDGAHRLHVKELFALNGTPLPETTGARQPFFSPDGSWLGFYLDGRLWKTRIAEPVRTPVCDVVPPVFGATWLPDDTIVFGNSLGRLMRVSADGDDVEVLTEPRYARGELRHIAPHALPDGRAILFTVETDSGPFVSVLDLSTGGWSRLSEGRWPRYLEAGFVVFASESNPETVELRALRFDAERLESIGRSFSVLSSVHAIRPAMRPFATTSESGTVVYLQAGIPGRHSRLVWVDREGRVSSAIEELGPYESPSLSPDGTRVAVAYAHANGKKEVWTHGLGSDTSRLIQDELPAARPFWTPDGSAVTYSDASGGIHVQSLDGGSRKTLIRWDGGVATAWHSSQPTVFTVRSTSTGFDIWALSSDGASTPILDGARDAHSPRPSPDGRWLAFVSNDTGQNEVYLRPYPGRGRTLTVSPGGGTDPVWSPSGNELFYRTGNILMAVPMQTSPHAIIGRPQELFELPFLDAIDPIESAYDAAEGGQRFLMVQPVESHREERLHAILNWDLELDR